MTNSIPTVVAKEATAENATSGRFAAIWHSIQTLFAPASSEQEPDIELPDSAVFSVRLSFSRHDLLFTCTKESFKVLRSYLSDPGCRSFFFQSHWVNKEILCNAFVEAYADSKILCANSNNLAKRPRALDKEASAQPSTAAGCHLPSQADDRLDPLACNNNLDQGCH